MSIINYNEEDLPLYRERAAITLAPLPPPKVSKTGKTIPSYLTSSSPGESILPGTDLRLANLDITTMRNERTSQEVIRKLSKASPDLSAAVAAATRMAISQKSMQLAKNPDGSINEDGTRLFQQLFRRFDLLHPTGQGYNPYRSMRSLSESLSGELLRYGACSLELILGPARLPEGFRPISVTNISFAYRKKKLVPIQKLGADEIELDIPTYFYVYLDQDLVSPYPDSPVQSALQPIIASQEFTNDLRRIFRKAIHPRQTVKIVEESFRKNIPPEIQHDPDKLRDYMDSTLADLETKMNGLNPEDCLVHFDTIEPGLMDKGNVSLSDEYKVLSAIIDGKLAAGAKTAGIVLNHASAASQNIASTSSMLFVKTVEGAVQGKLNEIYSRAFTQALRLFGLDVVAEFTYSPIDLRPTLELEAFEAMKQSRVLEQLSLGLLSDVEASLILTGSLPEVGAAPLSGTMFKSKMGDSGGNPTSNTSPGQGSSLNQSLSPDTPTGQKSQKAG